MGKQSRRKRSKREQQPSYIDQIQQARAEGKFKPGKVYSVTVAHDGWCALLNGSGPCNCNPEVMSPVELPK